MSYDDVNKLHLMLGGEVYATKKAKDLFIQDLKEAKKREEEYCRKYNKEVKMTDATFNIVVGLVEKCSSFFEVEALARYIYNDNIIPTYEEVKKRGATFRKLIPVYEFLQTHKNPRRSY